MIRSMAACLCELDSPTSYTWSTARERGSSSWDSRRKTHQLITKQAIII
jgi:hypothetical protein